MHFDKQHPDFLTLRKRIREESKEFVAIVGAGLSKRAGLPSWEKLRDDLTEYAENRASGYPQDRRDDYLRKIKSITEESDHWRAFEELKNLLPLPAYTDYIKESLTLKFGKTIPDAYRQLWKLNIKGVISYNLDRFAIDSYSEVNGSAPDFATGFEASRYLQYQRGANQFVFHPHGHLSDPDSWVLTSTERDRLLGSQSYIQLFKTLWQTKSFLFIGFGVDDLSFVHLVIQAASLSSASGVRHYIVAPNPNESFVREWGGRGVLVVPYFPQDHDRHVEVDEILAELVSFTSKDQLAPSIYTGELKNADTLPSDVELLTMPIDDLRKLLNGAVASLIPPGTTPTESDLKRVDEFYRKHLRAIHMAWLVGPDEGCNLIHGYKVLKERGRGAFGQVYEVTHELTGERLALKVLLPEVRNNSEYINSFRRGVNSMKILTKRKVDGMVSFRSAFEVPACVLMDFVDGPTLTEAKSWTYLSTVEKCLEVITKIGEIVDSAHSLDEVVLHRDLKPDNVILRNMFLNEDDIDVVVLDFDLSWHKGALELSVVHGARAQGYAAPEQTASSLRGGISTRSRAVDVFGLGMIAYFVFLGENPRPNEQNFSDFRSRIRDQIRDILRCRWKALPGFLADLIVECTYDEQANRISFRDAVNGFKSALNMAMKDQITSSDPLLLREIAATVDPDAYVELEDFGRSLRFSGMDSSKQISLSLKNAGNGWHVQFKISKVASAGDNRNVSRYLESARDRGVSKLNFGEIKNLKGVISLGAVEITGEWKLKNLVDRADIVSFCTRISDARVNLDLR